MIKITITTTTTKKKKKNWRARTQRTEEANCKWEESTQGAFDDDVLCRANIIIYIILWALEVDAGV